MGIKQLYNDNLRKLPNEYGDVSVIRKHAFNAVSSSESFLPFLTHLETFIKRLYRF